MEFLNIMSFTFTPIRRNFIITSLVFLSVRTSSRVLRSERTNRSNRRNSDNRTSKKKPNSSPPPMEQREREKPRAIRSAAMRETRAAAPNVPIGPTRVSRIVIGPLLRKRHSNPTKVKITAARGNPTESDSVSSIPTNSVSPSSKINKTKDPEPALFAFRNLFSGIWCVAKSRSSVIFCLD